LIVYLYFVREDETNDELFCHVELAENSRRWSREKTEMALQLQEAKHGLVRPSPSHRLSPIPVRITWCS